MRSTERSAARTTLNAGYASTLSGMLAVAQAGLSRSDSDL